MFPERLRLFKDWAKLWGSDMVST